MTAAILLLVASTVPGGPGLTADTYVPQVGDLIVFNVPSAKTVVFTLAGSPCATHAAIVVARPDGSLGLFEAPGFKYSVMISDIPSRLNCSKGQVWVRRRKVPVTAEQSAALTAFACRQLGKPYDKVGLYFPTFATPTRWFTSRYITDAELDPPRWFCTSVVVGAGVAAGLLDRCKVRLKTVDPQDFKPDRFLDLSDGWHKPAPWRRCGPREPGWWSIDCCGNRAWWDG